MTADSTVRGIRELDGAGHQRRKRLAPTIGPHSPRPCGKERTWIVFGARTADVGGVKLHLGTEAARIDVTKGQIVHRQGGRYSSERSFLATGGSPGYLPFGRSMRVGTPLCRMLHCLRQLLSCCSRSSRSGDEDDVIRC